MIFELQANVLSFDNSLHIVYMQANLKEHFLCNFMYISSSALIIKVETDDRMLQESALLDCLMKTRSRREVLSIPLCLSDLFLAPIIQLHMPQSFPPTIYLFWS